MRENLELTHGALFSQRVLLALVAAGATRDDAYRVVQRLAQRALDERTPLRQLLAADPAGAGLDLDAIFDYAPFVRSRARDRRAARRDRLAATPPGRPHAICTGARRGPRPRPPARISWRCQAKIRAAWVTICLP